MKLERETEMSSCVTGFEDWDVNQIARAEGQSKPIQREGFNEFKMK